MDWRARIDPVYTALGLRIALGCDTLEEAILAVAQLYRAASCAVHFELKAKHDVAVVSVHAESLRGSDALLLEDIYLSWIFMHCMYFLGGAMPVTSVSTRDPLHFCLDGKHFAIDAPVRHGTVTGMQFPRALLGRRSLNRAGANPHWECFRLWLDFIEHRGGATERNALCDLGGLRMKEMAVRAGVSTSTMRRRLLSDGGFRQARERKLVTAAVDRLRNSDESVESIAAELGYSDARSLRRFLKATTGATPQQLRMAVFSPQPDDREARVRLQEIGAAMAHA
ncbi:helix-turn-helix domain-containing protein [Bradyrhizobium sp. Gha]|uniref:helix-turn-helix transcriptional regulator n=1 Tax=Bradyrhizobium sp. Gha TaxID=1855318 RepID=UPI0008F0C751|nr:helix-turn-helix domain-containing protein [Bradyrhizobium sp. Gha]SFJ07084.1 AraC-type DNA-binding protein [Bradyrhizobium sp. Gha]